MGQHMLKLPYLTRKRAKGRDYFYYRRDGRWMPLPSPTDPNFSSDYDRIHTSFSLTSEAARPGTFRWLVETFKASPGFLDKKSRTQKDYRRHLDNICEVWGELQISHITRQGVMEYRDTLAHSPKQANYAATVIRLLFFFAIDRGLAKENPARNPKRLKEGPGHKPWPDEAVAKFREANADDKMMLLALDMGLYTGIRGGDLCRMTVSDHQDGHIKLIQSKTGEPVWIPVHPVLHERLSEIQDRLMLIATKTGRPFNEHHFRHRWRAAVLKAGLNGLTFHGLRTTAGMALAEAGCTDAEIQAILGQRTQVMAAHYRRHANKKKLAESGMRKLQRSRPEA